MTTSSTQVLIIGGGTAGHVLPGVAIGNELVRRGHPRSTIHFVGSERGVERTIVPDAGYTLTLLPGRGIQRRLTKDNFGAVMGLVRAFISALSVMRTHRPAVVVALGGYASVPAGLWAVLLHIPIVVAEQNAVPGLANRIIGRFARACAVSFEGTDLPRAVWTGNPVRPEILAVANPTDTQRTAARAQLAVDDDRRLIVVFGGSLGARTINNAVVGALDLLRDRADIEIRHIIGTRDFADVTKRIEIDENADLRYTPVEYESDMATVYAAADLVICRAGATSVAELAVMGTPAILVPLPGAPGDHQTANGRALEASGGAEVLSDSVFDSQLLVDTIVRLLATPTILESMRSGSSDVARPDAAGAVVDLVEQYGGLAHGAAS